jgi:hypothetical protein
MRLLTALLIAWFLPCMAAAEDRSSRIQKEVVIKALLRGTARRTPVILRANLN